MVRPVEVLSAQDQLTVSGLGRLSVMPAKLRR